MNISRTKLAIVAIVGGQLLVPLSASADPVRIAGAQAFNLTTGGATRAASVQKNIDNALVATNNHTPSAVGVVYVKGQPVITLGGFYVTTVDSASAKVSHTTPSILAQKWSAGLKTAMKSKTAVDDYVAQLSGSTTANAGTTTTNAGSYPYYRQGRIVYIPAGMTIPIALKNSVTSENAHTGDVIEGQIAQTVNLGDTSIPAGSLITGKITEAQSGQRMGKSGMLGVKFDTLRTPDGQTVPINAHIVGGIGRFQEVGAQSNVVKGEATSDKVKQALIRGGIGAGGGALLGTTLGAIAGGGHGAGRGAIAGTVIGGVAGVAESLLYRKGGDVSVSSGQTVNLQLDAPASLSVSM
ncbi:MAG TPA: hypothetical protein V6D22_04400 [Candidatus Obscuribacterales bacterium]